MQKIRWGIYGPGNIANRFAEAMQVVPDGHITAVAGRTPERAKAFAVKHGIANVFPDLASLARSTEIDAVYIATTHNVHCEATCTCLSAGKAVLCEKPLAMNAREVNQMIKLANEHDAFLMEALWTRFLPVWTRVRNLLQQNAIGTPQMVHANFCATGTFDPQGRMLNKDLAGGALLDLGVYPIAMAQMILPGPVQSVQATGVIGPTGVDVRTAITLQFTNHTIAQLSAGLGMRTDNGLTIAGDAGRIQIPDPFWGGARLVWTTDGKTLNEEHHPHRKNGFEEQIVEVHQCLHDGHIESTIMSHADSLAIVTIMDAVRQQIGLQYPADLPE